MYLVPSQTAEFSLGHPCSTNIIKENIGKNQRIFATVGQGRSHTFSMRFVGLEILVK